MSGDAAFRPEGTALGWQVEVAADGTVTVTDDAGAVQARVEVPPRKVKSRPERGWIRHCATVPLQLPDQSTEVVNGRKGAMRRAGHNGWALVRGRRYEFVHTGRRRTSLLRDGQRIARLRRTGGRDTRPIAVAVEAELDATDRLMVVLTQQCVRAGRPGAVDAVLTGLGNLSA